MRLGSAIEQQINRGKVGQEFSPKLRIDGRDISEAAKFNTFLLEMIYIEIFFGLALGQESRGPQDLTDLDEKLCSSCFYLQIG